MNNYKTAMVLAAGFGNRLRPYSKLRPKPLFPVMGTPLLKHTIQQLREAGFETIIVNAHYLGQQITKLLAGEPDIIIQQENIELGTGGGLRKAMHKLGTAPALITNGDIYHAVDYDRIYHQHCLSHSPISLVMHDYPRFNKVQIQNGKVISFGNKNDNVQKLAFTGIQVIDPAILQNIPSGVFANIIDYYESYLLNGGQINTISINDFWHDMGTPDDYLALHSYLLKKRSPGDNWQPLNTMGFYKHKDAQMGHNTSCLDWGIIGSGATVGNNVSLERVVVWDGANVLDNTTVKDQIIT